MMSPYQLVMRRRSRFLFGVTWWAILVHSPALRDCGDVVFEDDPVVSAGEHERRHSRAIEAEGCLGESEEAFDHALVVRRIVDDEPLQAGLVGKHHVGRGAAGHLREAHLELAKTIEVRLESDLLGSRNPRGHALHAGLDIVEHALVLLQRCRELGR